MTLIELILVVVVVGMVLWLIDRFVPMSPPLKQLLTVVVVVIIILWVINLLFGPLPNIRIGR
jgi:hypothetical protein